MRFVKPVFIIILLIGFCFSFAGKTLALGGYLTGDYGQVAPVEVKAIIEYENGVETITAAQTFVFNPLIVSNFYWVMAFPAKVKIDKPDPKENATKDIFLDYDKKTAKKFSKNNLVNKLLYPDIIDEKSEQSNIFSRMVSLKYVKPLPEFKTIIELEEWFRKNAYPIPKSSRELFNEYVEKKWHFALAAVDGGHVLLNAKESLTVNGGHNIPLMVRFKTDKIIYQLKLVKVQSDYDSVATPLSFEYGTSAKDILGVEDRRAEALLSTPSSNIYPPLPLDLMNIKIDFFVLASEKVEADGFTTIFADRVGDKFLTRLVGNKPLVQLEDIDIKRARDQSRVNPNVSLIEKVIRFMVLLAFFYFTFRLIKKLIGSKS